MEKVKIGRTELTVNPLGLGTNKIGGYNLFPNLDDETGKQVVQTAIDHEVEMIDTAFMYGLGHSEELIGDVLKNNDREKVILATKGAQQIAADGAVTLSNNPEFLTQAVDESLKRLQTDYLDIFYIHFPDQDTPKAEAVGALQRLREAGKIRAIGISNFSLEQIKEADADGYVDLVENQYNLLQQDAMREVVPYLKERGITFVPYEPFAAALLTGRYNPDNLPHFEAGDHRLTIDLYQPDQLKRNVEKVEKLKPIASHYGVTTAQLVLAWYMKNPLIGPVIPGARTPEQLLANVASVSTALRDEDYQTIDHVFASSNL
ncbi:aldo/keto reductase [Sporolactobacillus terrae]|uniref:Aldo/keto reductase n=1 Tax=Sporolactobacillus terrae TaxID=269673 RepID=A0A410D7K4_9BACL|nr:aldo/keto reductase [Sporolactobacillus terrae]QAA22031.1 aldo/keto reductase [Sporolactobacillus terrae]QAA25004.1 aldo/keto reductase [Sporolactobacillus terrae]UAK16827.1 aldo/keto reductase [Sporolactobacillus terrae]BBN98321.1 oxidoreductase [Sporolactobacillus terrae]